MQKQLNELRKDIEADFVLNEFTTKEDGRTYHQVGEVYVATENGLHPKLDNYRVVAIIQYYPELTLLDKKTRIGFEIDRFRPIK